MTHFQIIEGDVLLRDSEGNPVASQLEGKLCQLATSDTVAHGLLEEILLELRKINMHLSLINGDVIKSSDIG